ncbi:MAG: hypothetical protein ACYCQI_03820 [Gammaproteobacteria bacterium]
MKIWIPFVGKVNTAKLFLGVLSVTDIIFGSRAQSTIRTDEVRINESPVERFFGTTALVTNKIQSHEIPISFNIIPQPTVRVNAKSYEACSEYSAWIEAWKAAGFANNSDKESNERQRHSRSCLA